MNKKIPVMIAAASMAALIASSGLAYDVAKNEKIEHEHKSSLALDADKNGVSDNVTLIKDTMADRPDYDIVKNATLRIEEGGKTFSAPLNEEICYKSSGLEDVTISDKINPFIGVSSCAPRTDDDWELILYSFDGNALTRQLKIVSNEPSIEVKDVDNDGTKDIVVMDRDYQNNPQIDKFLTTYQYINGKWQRASIYSTKTKELLKLKAEQAAP